MTRLRFRKDDQYPSHYGSSRISCYKDDIAKKKGCADYVGSCKGYVWNGGGIRDVESIGTDKTFSNKYGGNCPEKSANAMFSYAKSKGMDWGNQWPPAEDHKRALYQDGPAIDVLVKAMRSNGKAFCMGA